MSHFVFFWKSEKNVSIFSQMKEFEYSAKVFNLISTKKKKKTYKHKSQTFKKLEKRKKFLVGFF